MKKMFYALCCLCFLLILSNLAQAQENIHFVPYQGKYIVINDSLKALSADNAQLIYPVRDILSIDKSIPPEDWLRIYVQPNQPVVLGKDRQRMTKFDNFWLTTELSDAKQIGIYNQMLGTISPVTIHSPTIKQINCYFICYLLIIIFITILLAKIKRGRLFKNVLDEENSGYLLTMSWLISALLATPVLILIKTLSTRYEGMSSQNAILAVIVGWVILYCLLFAVNWFIYVLCRINLPRKSSLYSKYALFRLIGFIPLTLMLIIIAAKSFWAAIPAILLAGLVFLIIYYHDRPKKRNQIKPKLK